MNTTKRETGARSAYLACFAAMLTPGALVYGQALDIGLLNANGSASQFGTAPGNLLNDGFAYDPNLPYFATAALPGGTLPDTGFSAAASFISGSATADRFWQTDVSLAGESLDFIDLWGRTNAAAGEDGRHQNLTFSFFSGAGGGGSLLGTSSPFDPSGQTQSVAGSAYGRFDVSSVLNASQRAQVGSFRIDQPAAPAPNQFLLLQEIRAASGTPISPVPIAFVDRNTSEVSLQNGNTQLDIAAYTITSAAGTLNGDNWDSITSGPMNGTLDADNWIELSSGITNGFNLSEGELPGGSGGYQLPAEATLELGAIWSKNAAEDLLVQVVDQNGVASNPAVVFTGNGGSSFPVGDLDFNNMVDLDDWALMRAGLGGVFPNSTGGETYVMGDLDSDLDVDISDFRLFQEAFDAANPGFSFASAVAAEVPEPTTGMLLAGIGVVLTGLGRAGKGPRRLAKLSSAMRPIAILSCFALFVGNASAQTFNIIPAPANPATDVTESLAFDPGFGAQFLFDTPVSVADINTRNLGGINQEFATRGQGPVSVFVDNNNTITTNWIAYAQRSAALDAVGRIEVWFSDTDFGGALPQTEPDAFADIDDRSELDLFKSFQLSSKVTGRYAAMRFIRAPEGTINIGGREFRFLEGPEQFTLQVNTATGDLSIANVGGLAQSLGISAYEIASAGGSLTTSGFDGLAGTAGFPAVSSNNAGDGWELGGGSGSNLLAEAYLLGDSTVTTNADLTIGSGYDTSVDSRDLTFSYLLENGLRLTGAVEYIVPPGVTGDYNDDGRVDAADYTVWRDNLGSDSSVLANNAIPGVIGQAHYTQWAGQYGAIAGGATAATIPEPSSALLSLMALSFLSIRNRRSSRSHALRQTTNPSCATMTTRLLAGNPSRWSLVILLLGGSLASASTPDRIYLFGDDSNEPPAGPVNELGASNLGQVIGSQTGTTFDGVSLDHAGNTADFDSFADLTPAGDPRYIDVGDAGLQRPGATGLSVAADLDGNDYLFTLNGFGNPSNADDAYESVISYTGLINHYMQGWVRPTSAETPGSRQTVIRDTDQFRIHIDTDAAGIPHWGHFYANTSQFTDTEVTLNEWSHISHFVNGDRGIFWVNGVVVGVIGGFYQPNGSGPEGVNAGAQSLSIGADLTGTTPTPSNFFSGQLDDFDIRVTGDNSDEPGGADYGAFSLTEDNEFVRQLVESGQLVPGDVNGDLVVNGDGTGDASEDDVTFFIDNYLSQQVINFEVVGDLNSRLMMGDLNFSGTTNLFDWIILVQNHEDAALASSLNLGDLLEVRGVPEPATAASCIMLLVLSCVGRRSQSEM